MASETRTLDAVVSGRTGRGIRNKATVKELVSVHHDDGSEPENLEHTTWRKRETRAVMQQDRAGQ